MIVQSPLRASNLSIATARSLAQNGEHLLTTPRRHPVGLPRASCSGDDLAPVPNRYTCLAVGGPQHRQCPPAFHTGTRVRNRAARDATRGARTRGASTARRPGMALRMPTQAYGTARPTALHASGRPAAGFGAVRAHGMHSKRCIRARQRNRWSVGAPDTWLTTSCR